MLLVDTFALIIDNQSEAEKLAKEIGMPIDKICGEVSNNEKLCWLISRPFRCYSEILDGVLLWCNVIVSL